MIRWGAMARDRSRGSTSGEGTSGAGGPRPRPTVRGIGIATPAAPPPGSDPLPEPRESWPETVVVPVDELVASRSPSAAPKGPSVKPSPIVSIGPRAPSPSAPAATEVREVAEAKPQAAGATPSTLATTATQLAVRRSHAIIEVTPRELTDPRLVLLLAPDSPRAAAFRLLRDNLLATKAPRVIAVSSGARGDGKTTCAVNLALALAEKPAKRVLLLDGNFQSPQLATMFRVDTSTPTPSSINPPWVKPYRIVEAAPGLHVGVLVQEPGESPPTFNSRSFDLLVDHLSGSGYDHVVLDAASLDGSPAVTQMVATADGVLLAARAGETTARAARRAVAQLPPGRGLGFALVDAKP